jgi:hypothetical protein
MIYPLRKINIWRSKLHPDDRARVIKSIEECYAGTSNSWSEDFRFKSRWYLW